MKKLILLITVLAFWGCDNPTASTDCAGVVNGTATIDDCGVCDGGNADKDCAGVCGGTTEQSYCDNCASATFDCIGICDGTAIVDCAGVCEGDGGSCACMDGNTCEELDVLFEQAVIEYNHTVDDINANSMSFNLMDSINTCIENNCPSIEPDIDYSFPLNIGNTWTYVYYRSFRCFEDADYQIIDHEAELLYENGGFLDTSFYQVTLTIIEQKVIFNSLSVYELEFHFVNADTNFYEFAYINEDLSGLNLYATKTKTGLGEVYINYLPRSIIYNDIIMNNFFGGVVLSNNIDEAECNDYTYEKWDSPLSVLEYPVQLNKYWVNVAIGSIYKIICETDNEVISQYQTHLSAFKGYTDISEGCLMTETYASLPLLGDDLNYLFTKKYCDYGIESTLNTYKLGEQIVVDAQGIGISHFAKIETSFQLIGTNVVPNN